MKVVVNRTDPRFDTLKREHNARFPASASDEPDRILFCSSPEEIVQALRKVIAAGLRPTVSSATIPTVLSLICRCTTLSTVMVKKDRIAWLPAQCLRRLFGTLLEFLKGLHMRSGRSLVFSRQEPYIYL